MREARWPATPPRSAMISGRPEERSRAQFTAASPRRPLGSANSSTRGRSPVREASAPPPGHRHRYCLSRRGSRCGGRRAGARRATRNSTTLRPAFSISVRLGTPYRSVVRRSIRCISEAVRIFIVRDWVRVGTGTRGSDSSPCGAPRSQSDHWATEIEHVDSNPEPLIPNPVFTASTRH